jgi:thiol-disulfide isomerase/thioredoxin
LTSSSPEPSSSAGPDDLAAKAGRLQIDRRHLLYAGIASLAALGGAGLAWWRHQPTAVGAEADSEFWAQSFDTPEGGRLAMQRFHGRPLLVNFWATWCSPCVEEMPLLDSFYRENSSKSWQVVGLAVDKPDPVRRFLQRVPVSYPIAMADATGLELGRALGNSQGGLPFSVVFGAGGAPIHRKIGKLSPDDLQQWLAQPD